MYEVQNKTFKNSIHATDTTKKHWMDIYLVCFCGFVFFSFNILIVKKHGIYSRYKKGTWSLVKKTNKAKKGIKRFTNLKWYIKTNINDVLYH